LVSPQLDAGRVWEPLELHTFRAALLAQLHVDPLRVSATGLSLGGHGVWHWAARFPDTLAAIAPVCGFGRPADACAVRQVPVRAYHGAVDSVVPLQAHQAMVDAHRACGGRVDFIVYPGVDHNSWDPAYADPALVPWLLAAQSTHGKAPA
jgi:predicted peptidase